MKPIVLLLALHLALHVQKGAEKVFAEKLFEDAAKKLPSPMHGTGLP